MGRFAVNVLWCSWEVQQLRECGSMLKPYLSREASEGAVQCAEQRNVRCCPFADYERPGRKWLIVDWRGGASKQDRACSGVEGGKDECEAVSAILGHELDELSPEHFLDIGDRGEGVTEIVMDEIWVGIVWKIRFVLRGSFVEVDNSQAVLLRSVRMDCRDKDIADGQKCLPLVCREDFAFRNWCQGSCQRSEFGELVDRFHDVEGEGEREGTSGLYSVRISRHNLHEGGSSLLWINALVDSAVVVVLSLPKQQ